MELKRKVQLLEQRTAKANNMINVLWNRGVEGVEFVQVASKKENNIYNCSIIIFNPEKHGIVGFTSGDGLIEVAQLQISGDVPIGTVALAVKKNGFWYMQVPVWL